jgi:preprotein translocase subunit SecD
MARRLWTSLIGVVVVVVGLFGVILATGNTPVLGLDLQGGVSVILAPVEDASTSDLEVVRDLIRDELERRGIAEPDVRVQGETIVVDLPGVRDQQDALSAVDVSGVVELRPVLNVADCQGALTESTPPTTSPAGPVAPSDSTPGSVPDVSVAPPADSTVGSSVAPTGLRRAAPDPTVPTGTAPTGTVPTGTTPTDTAPTDTIPTDSLPGLDLSEFPDSPVTATGAEVLPTRDGAAICVGPAQGTGEVFERGSATLTADLGFGVAVNLRDDGQATWNNLATQCYNTAPSCPSTQPGVRGQIAIVLDSVVQSSPQVNQPNFTDSVAISGNFSRGEAEDLVAVLNRGAFPVEVEAQEARIVSPSAGNESLRAAVVAGVVGVLLVVALLVAYYRWLGLVVIGGMIVWALMVFVLASIVSIWTNYALTVAGVTGIIVSIGVTVDSYIVYFERIKDEMRAGRTVRNASPRSFASTWRTIWAANIIALMSAVILFWLSVGSVRGFALYLGLTTICDLLVVYFFTRPSVLLLSRSAFVARKKRVLGMEVAP